MLLSDVLSGYAFSATKTISTFTDESAFFSTHMPQCTPLSLTVIRSPIKPSSADIISDIPIPASNTVYIFPELRLRLPTRTIPNHKSSQTNMSNSITRNALTPREAIADTIHTAILGLDTSDRALFASTCLTASASITVVAGPYIAQGWPAIEALFEPVFRLVTTHILSNMRIHFVEDDVAKVTTHAISYHVRSEDAFGVEDKKYTAGSLYDIEVVKEDGQWKMRRWEIQVLWTVGDRGIMEA
jgi:hypothetical protein